MHKDAGAKQADLESEAQLESAVQLVHAGCQACLPCAEDETKCAPGGELFDMCGGDCSSCQPCEACLADPTLCAAASATGGSLGYCGECAALLG